MSRFLRLLCVAFAVFGLMAPMFDAAAEMRKTRRFHGSAVPSSGRTTNDRLAQIRADRCMDKCTQYTAQMAAKCEPLADLKRDHCTEAATQRSQRCQSDCARKFPNYVR